jgi:WD40 repeat protein
VPEKILDAPELKDDYYLNLLDWSNCGPLAIGLNQRVYLYTPQQISELCALDDAYVCSVAFHPHNPLLAVGTSTGRIHLYDI